MERITIYDLATEMQTWTDVPEEILQKAKESSISTETHKAFRSLAYKWANGDFDEDPDYVVEAIKYLLQN